MYLFLLLYFLSDFVLSFEEQKGTVKLYLKFGLVSYAFIIIVMKFYRNENFILICPNFSIVMKKYSYVEVITFV